MMQKTENGSRPDAQAGARLPAEQRDPVDSRDDDACCWICGGPVIQRHCKIVCPRCGFTRDCSDP